MAEHDHKIAPDDEGGLAVACFVRNGHIVLNFGKPIRWVALGREEVETLIDALKEKLEEL